MTRLLCILPALALYGLLAAIVGIAASVLVETAHELLKLA